MYIESLRFGKMECGQDKIIMFCEGILGFPDLRRFLRIAPDDEAPVEFLMPVDEPRLLFPLLNPYLLREDYDLVLAEDDRRALKLDNDGSVLVYCVANLSVAGSTLNLRAPIVINPDLRCGRQVVMDNRGYATRAPLFDKKGEESAHARYAASNR